MANEVEPRRNFAQSFQPWLQAKNHYSDDKSPPPLCLSLASRGDCARQRLSLQFDSASGIHVFSFPFEFDILSVYFCNVGGSISLVERAALSANGTVGDCRTIAECEQANVEYAVATTVRWKNKNKSHVGSGAGRVKLTFPQVRPCQAVVVRSIGGGETTNVVVYIDIELATAVE